MAVVDATSFSNNAAKNFGGAMYATSPVFPALLHCGDAPSAALAAEAPSTWAATIVKGFTFPTSARATPLVP